jgi:hypothetical protein
MARPFPVARQTFTRVAPPKRAEYRWGPITRQRDRTISLNTAGEAAISSLNCWIQDADTEFPILQGRPGFVIAHQSMGATAAVQWVGQLSKANGTEVSAVVAAGEIWAYTWATDTLAKVVTTANLTTASVTLSASARVYACQFADTLVFTDGTNRPFTWDGTSGAGGVTSLTNGPAVAYGAPWVHYGKLWFIKNAERSTVVWSEEGAANTGYEASYSNAWTLRQAGTEGFYAGASTNDGLWLFRANSITKIMGEVTPNFSTTANDEAIEQIGCRSPSAVLNLNSALFFLSSDRRIMRIGADGNPTDVSHGARQRLAALNAAQFAKAFVEFVDLQEQGERVIVAIAETGIDDPNAHIVVNPATGLVEGTWTGWRDTALGRWKNASGEWRLVHGGGDAATSVDDGLVYIHDVPNGTTLNDEFLAGESPIAHQVETSYIGADANVEKGWLEGTLLMQATTGTTTGISVTIKTPRGNTALADTLSFAATGAEWGSAIWGIDEWSSETGGERRITFATRGVVGRHARALISHSELDERFGLSEVTLAAAITHQRPTVK